MKNWIPCLVLPSVFGVCNLLAGCSAAGLPSRAIDMPNAGDASAQEPGGTRPARGSDDAMIAFPVDFSRRPAPPP